MVSGSKDEDSNARENISPDGLPALREVIAAHDLSARKSLGQNFILDLNLTRRIARIAGRLEGLSVVEVGPGPGGLTRALFLEGAQRVCAIERDKRCLAALQAVSDAYPGRLEILSDDALSVDFRKLIGKQSGNAVIVANLPYNVATQLLVKWLETNPWPPWYLRMALMFQKEVAERIVAPPNTKTYGRLSVLSQWRAKVSIKLNLKPQAFTPPPKVASAVVLFEPRAVASPKCSVDALGQVTAAAFGQRRKMLRQSLKSLIDDPAALLSAAGIRADRRAETLDVREFAQLAYTFERLATR